MDTQLNPSTEYFTHTAIYTTDGFNLRLHEETRDGLMTDYSYLPNTNLVTAILNGHVNGGYHKREFRTYSSDHLLIETLIDNGLSSNPHDLTGVTCRTFTSIVPRLSGLAIGFPQTIVEGYIDLQTGMRHQLKRTSYDTLGHLQTLQSSDGTISYRYVYDLNSNLLQSDDLVNGQTTNRQYDTLNRLTAERLATGLTFAYAYDPLGRIQHVTLRIVQLLRIHMMERILHTVSRSDYQHTYAEYDWCGRELQSQWWAMPVRSI